MKLFFTITALLLCQSVFATVIEGKIFYKTPNGEVVDRVVNIEVPSQGQGEVILSGKSFEWRSTDFTTIKKDGKTSFVIGFKTKFMGFKSTIAFVGTYIRGTNQVNYYGDMYKKKGHHEVNGDVSGFDFNGGFQFRYDL